MGAGIAAIAAVQAGVAGPAARTRICPHVGAGLRAAAGIVNERVRRRSVTKRDGARQLALVSGGIDYAGFHRADLVIEAVFEDLAVKQAVLREVEAVARPTCVFASNTSTIPIARIAEASRRPETVVGMHFFSPVHRMPLLEVIVGGAHGARDDGDGGRIRPEDGQDRHRRARSPRLLRQPHPVAVHERGGPPARRRARRSRRSTGR